MPRYREFMIIGLAMLVGLEAAALLEQILAPNGLPSNKFSFEVIDNFLYELLRPFSPGLFIVLLYILPSRFVITSLKGHSKKLSGFITWLSKPYSRLRGIFLSNWEGPHTPLFGRPFILLLIAIASGCLLVYTPYRSDLNPQGIPLGQDTVHYILSASQMLGKAPVDALYYAFREDSFGGSRPLLFILLYAASVLTSLTPDVVVKFLPMVLAPSLAVSSYLFVYVGMKSRATAGLASLLSVFSFQVTVGMWAGYYANWLGLVESYILLGGFLVFSRTSSKRYYLVMLGLSITLLFTHPWTWTFLLLLLLAYTVDNYLRNHDTRLVRPISTLIILNVLADAGRVVLVGGRGGSSAALGVAAAHSGIAQPASFFQNLAEAVLLSYDGSLAITLLIGFGILALWGLYNARDSFSRILVLWTLIVAAAEPFLEPLIETRLLYLLPLPVLASGGMLATGKAFRSRVSAALLFAFLLLFSANFTLRSILQL